MDQKSVIQEEDLGEVIGLVEDLIAKIDSRMGSFASLCSGQEKN